MGMLVKPGVLIRIEGAILFALSLLIYHSLGASWIIFFSIWLWPDISMLGYFAGPRVGASLYNLVHTMALALALTALALLLGRPGLTAFAVIWFSHIGLDRALGYGLKYPTFFKDTSLQHLR